MNTDQHVARLEALLAKIRRNAAMPHVASVPRPDPEIAEIEEEDLEIADADIAEVDERPRAKAFDTRAAVRAEAGIEPEPPKSSDRSRAVASTMEEALAEVSLQAEPRQAKPERPSAATAALAMAAFQLDDAQELALNPRPGAHIVAEDYAPTVELEEPFDAELELDDAPPPSVPDRSLVPGHKLAEPADQELASVPPPVSSVAPQMPSGGEPIWPAPEEAEPLRENGAAPRPPTSERHPSAAATSREIAHREPEVAAPIPLVKVLPSIEPEPAAPELLSRPQADRSAQPLRYIRATREFQPRTFVELLDASLSLGTDRA